MRRDGRCQETWRCSGVSEGPAGVLLLDRLLGLLQLRHVFVMSFRQIVHMSHHELDCPAHSSLLTKTERAKHLRFYMIYTLQSKCTSCMHNYEDREIIRAKNNCLKP